MNGGRGSYLLLSVLGGALLFVSSCERPPRILELGSDQKPVASVVGPPHVQLPPLDPRSIVRAKSLAVWFGKPPLKEHTFDVEIRNPASEPRWLVLPREFPLDNHAEQRPGKTECEIQLFELAAAPRTVIAYGVCSHFWAVRLAPGAVLALSKLRIESDWSKIPDDVDLEVLVAKDIVVGTQSLAAIAGDAASSGGTFLAPNGAADERSLKFWHPPNHEHGESLPVEITIESHAKISVPLVKGP